MRKAIGLLSIMIFAGILAAQAQHTPRVDQRQEAQRHRIQNGVKTGELTRVEAADARHGQRSIKRAECRAKADGMVTPQERARLNHKQNKAGRQLQRNKHDAQERPRAR